MKYTCEFPKIEGTYKFEANDGYTFNPKITTPIIIDKITMYDNDLISFYIYNKFTRKYKKILYIVMTILTDDSSGDAEYEIALTEIEKQRHLINVKYIKYLKKQETLKYLKKLDLLEQELKQKYMLSRLYIQEENKKGR